MKPIDEFKVVAITLLACLAIILIVWFILTFTKYALLTILFSLFFFFIWSWVRVFYKNRKS